MKKARKLGLQSLALVLMAFVLVAGVAFGMTGAWFQSAQQTSNDIQMGHEVNIKLFEGETQLTGTPATITLTHARDNNVAGNFGDQDMDHAMPGDTYTLTGDITLQSTSNNAKMYLFVKITVADGTNSINLGNMINDNALTGEGVNKLTYSAGDTYVEGYNIYVIEKSDSDRSYVLWGDADVIEIDENLTNAVADQHLTVAIDVRACQVANRTLAEAATTVGLTSATKA